MSCWALQRSDFIGEHLSRSQSVACGDGATLTDYRLRMMLRVPLITHTEYGMTSRAVAARSATQILRIYSSLSSTFLFGPKWSDTRRITTAAHVVVLCLIDGELKEDEAKPLAEMGLELLRRQRHGCPAAAKALDSLKTLMDLGGESAVVVSPANAYHQRLRTHRI